MKLIKNLRVKWLQELEKKKIIVKLKNIIKNILKNKIKNDSSFDGMAQFKFK